MLNLDKNKYYLLACSFGPDSMALLHMLKVGGYHFMVAHVNYGVRKESIEETRGLNDYCAQNDIEIEVFYNQNPAKVGNFEGYAREIRYNFFKKIYDEHNCDALLIAHQQDDLIETYYLQRKRGGYIETWGLTYDVSIYGMEVIRPLLNFTKKGLEEYCQNNEVPYAIDSSNLSDDFQRNVIRHTIVEKMSESERDIVVNEINLENEKIEKIYDKIKAMDLNVKENILSLEIEEFYRAITYLARHTEEGVSLSIKCMDEIRKILLSKKPNVTSKIHDGLIFIKEYEHLDFISDQEDSLYSFEIPSPMKFETQFFFLDFSNGTNGKDIKESDYPLTIRSAKKEDIAEINFYKVEVRRLFIDWKMPGSLRKKWPVILNKEGKVIYVPRYQKDFKKENDPTFFVKI